MRGQMDTTRSVTYAAVHHVGLNDGALPADVLGHRRAAHLQMFHLKEEHSFLSQRPSKVPP